MDNINYSAPPINEDPRLDDDLRKVAIAHPQKLHMKKRVNNIDVKIRCLLMRRATPKSKGRERERERGTAQ